MISAVQRSLSRGPRFLRLELTIVLRRRLWSALNNVRHFERSFLKVGLFTRSFWGELITCTSSSPSLLDVWCKGLFSLIISEFSPCSSFPSAISVGTLLESSPLSPDSDSATSSYGSKAPSNLAMMLTGVCSSGVPGCASSGRCRDSLLLL